MRKTLLVLLTPLAVLALAAPALAAPVTVTDPVGDVVLDNPFGTPVDLPAADVTSFTAELTATTFTAVITTVAAPDPTDNSFVTLDLEGGRVGIDFLLTKNGLSMPPAGAEGTFTYLPVECATTSSVVGNVTTLTASASCIGNPLSLLGARVQQSRVIEPFMGPGSATGVQTLDFAEVGALTFAPAEVKKDKKDKIKQDKPKKIKH